jgi:hypothetical protein
LYECEKFLSPFFGGAQVEADEPGKLGKLGISFRILVARRPLEGSGRSRIGSYAEWLFAMSWETLMSHSVFVLWARSAVLAIALGAGAAAAAPGDAARELAGYVSIQGMQARIEHRGGLLAQACRGRSAEIDQLLSESDQLRVTHRALIEAIVLKTREQVQKEIGVEAGTMLYQDLKAEQDEAALRFRQTFQLAGGGGASECLQATQVHLRLQRDIEALLN